MQFNSEGGNLDERVPYIGYAGESEAYTAAGVSAYNALQAHVEKRLSHGLQAGFLTPTPTRSMSKALWDSSTTAATRSICGAATDLRTSTARTCSTSTITTNCRSFSRQSIRGRQIRQRLERSGSDHAAKRPALQHRRLFRRRRQHLLQHQRRHHESDRSARSGLHAGECVDRRDRQQFRFSGAQGVLLHVPLPALPAT